ncbi:MAG: hypothetical protein BWY69_00248 [Planctomycetes bacterium ADurb.Bin401]|nr:MAG: hypothetical protein BWY69_00248 [Planctomycetes bacterium ADurb.Bin401]
MYITEAEIENYLKRDLTAEESEIFETIESAAREQIDNYCDTNWDENTEEESRYYDGGNQEINIDPCKSISAVAYVDEEFETDDLWESDDYVAEPINKTIKTSIRVRAGKSCRGIGNIKVTALFTSYDTQVPPGVKLACLKLCSSIFENPLGLKSENIEGYGYAFADKIQSDDELQKILSPYRQVLL